MKEAEITCLINRLRLADLNLDMVRGQQVRVPETQARASADLERFSRLGGVLVRYVEVAQVLRRTAAEVAQVLRRPPPWSPPRTPPPQEVPSGGVSIEQVRVIVREELEEFKAQLLLELRLMLRDLRPVMSPAPQGVSLAPQGGATQAPEEFIPVFIPARIGGDELKAEINVAAENTTSATVDDAAAALRAARGRKKNT